MKLPHSMTDRETALHCLAGIDPRGLAYDEWLGVGMALKTAGATVADWESWSRADSARFNDGECARKWAGFNGDGWGVGSLVKLFRDAGGTYPPPAGDVQRASA
ncbi:MAG TPA: PriCT-2 domain-containing protein, partial [Kiritimatiellia bacterium]|nr:PriCT-2 domain-containing protein [Kiritimatiellia bacterium]